MFRALWLAIYFVSHARGLTVTRTYSYRRGSLAERESYEKSGEKLKAYVKSAIESANDHGRTITVQATCHSYSGVQVPIEGGIVLNLLEFDHTLLDKRKKLISVQPGVRFVDVLKPLKDAKLSLPVHGDYSGQTIIGAVMTGTHGFGFRQSGNFVTKMQVINGNGKEETLTPKHAHWGAWLNSNGCLGVVTEMTMVLVAPFHIESSAVRVHTIPEAAAHMKSNPMNTISWSANPLVQAFLVQIREVTNKPITSENECCHSLPAVFDYMNDFSFSPSLEPEHPTSRHCHQYTTGVYEIAGRSMGLPIDPGISYPALSADISVPLEQLEQTIFIFKNIPLDNRTTFYCRYTEKDDYLIPLSPFIDSGMVGCDVSVGSASLPQFAGETLTGIEAEYVNWKADIILLFTELKAAGIDVKYHLGKTGFMELPFSDEVRFNEFKKVNEKEDPLNVFTNEWFDLTEKHFR